MDTTAAEGSHDFDLAARLEGLERQRRKLWWLLPVLGALFAGALLGAFLLASEAQKLDLGPYYPLVWFACTMAGLVGALLAAPKLTGLFYRKLTAPYFLAYRHSVVRPALARIDRDLRYAPMLGLPADGVRELPFLLHHSKRMLVWPGRDLIWRLVDKEAALVAADMKVRVILSNEGRRVWAICGLVAVMADRRDTAMSRVPVICWSQRLHNVPARDYPFPVEPIVELGEGRTARLVRHNIGSGEFQALYSVWAEEGAGADRLPAPDACERLLQLQRSMTWPLHVAWQDGSLLGMVESTRRVEFPRNLLDPPVLATLEVPRVEQELEMLRTLLVRLGQELGDLKRPLRGRWAELLRVAVDSAASAAPVG